MMYILQMQDQGRHLSRTAQLRVRWRDRHMHRHPQHCRHVSQRRASVLQQVRPSA